jgi:hypothetical protein
MFAPSWIVHADKYIYNMLTIAMTKYAWLGERGHDLFFKVN